MVILTLLDIVKMLPSGLGQQCDTEFSQTNRAPKMRIVSVAANRPDFKHGQNYKYKISQGVGKITSCKVDTAAKQKYNCLASSSSCAVLNKWYLSLLHLLLEGESKWRRTICIAYCVAEEVVDMCEILSSVLSVAYRTQYSRMEREKGV
uniref:Uncharacterized protein n=1 Tax=Trypanosoma vivax (strain Y486) TaxID=1055687 RepID=G0UBU0_TRYVY|nr:hypothetical protein, unlikely [Trypanosoma vivax Y486]